MENSNVAMFNDKGGIVEIEPVLYEKGHRSIFGQALEEAGYQIFYGDIQVFIS